jgi:hypothetical protein
MQFMVVLTWPLSSTTDVGRISVELLSRPMPEYLKRVGLYVVPGGDGVKEYALYESGKGQEEAAYKEILNRFVEYKTVSGFRFTIENVLPAEEALGLIGMG